ncbi:MAG: hypothetical protein ACE5IJ_08250 [Thermoplasmata archaeon]
MTSAEIADLDTGFQEVVPVCDKHREEIRNYPNVVGVGVSLKLVKFEVTSIPCIVVFVREKVRDLKRSDGEIVPADFGGVPTDIVESGSPLLRVYDGRIRPARPGYSVGHTSISKGTLGCMVLDLDSETEMVLSNNHVLANSNNASQGDPIVQPGPDDGGNHPADTIAELARFKPIVAGQNKIDAAVATPTEADLVEPAIPGGIGIPSGVHQIDSVGEYVQKVGRSSQHTSGIVTAYDASIYPLHYPGIGDVEFVESIVTTGMSQGGDSGSLLLDMDKKGVGLLFAGMSRDDQEIVTYYNGVRNVLDILKVTLVTA